MSLFLGPIHYWLYNKIDLQNKIVDNIIEKLNIKDINNYLDNNFGYLENKPLEDMINTENIHGWLQEKVNVVENRLAYVVKYALQQNNDNLQIIKGIFYNFGKNINVNGDKNDATIIFKTIDDNLLDGMPCDRAKVILEKSYDKVIFERKICVHKKYWDNMEIDVNIYYDLVNEFIFGILSNTKFTIKKDNNIFEIYENL